MSAPLLGFNRYAHGTKVRITAEAVGYVCTTTVELLTIDDENGRHRVLATDAWDTLTVEPIDE